MGKTKYKEPKKLKTNIIDSNLKKDNLLKYRGKNDRKSALAGYRKANFEISWEARGIDTKVQGLDSSFNLIYFWSSNTFRDWSVTVVENVDPEVDNTDGEIDDFIQ